MKKGWTEVALGDVLDLDLDAVKVDPAKSYDMTGVLSYGRGLFIKPAVSGADTSYKIFYRLHEGQIVLSQLFGWEGAIAPVEKKFKDRFVSSQFPTFRPKNNMDGQYVKWILRNPDLWNHLKSSAKGMGDRRRTLNPEILFNIQVFVPSLVEQQRIATHLDAVEERLQRVQKLREEQELEILAALRSAFHKMESVSEWVEMEEVAPLVRRPVEIDPDGRYPELGVRSFGRGAFHKPDVLGIETTKRLFEIQEGDLLFSNVFAWEGAIAVAQKEDHGRVGSHRFMSCVCDRDRVFPELLQFYFLTAAGLEKIGQASPGGAGRNRTLGINKLEKIKVPIPSMKLQNEFLKLLNLRDKIKAEADKSIQRREALLPSLLDRIFGEDGK